ncbi:MAG: quinone-dependent dihydroorotate dehydrogenase, partial [Candidatus Magasanikbacteria bacterium CG_4_10_14_0_2_um_filter_41_10]
MFPIDQIVHYTYKYIAKPFLFRRDPEDVHDTALTLGKTLGKSVLVKSFFRVCFGHQDDSLRQTVCGITFQNPIGLAAGFDKNADILDILPTIGFGYAEVGSVTGGACVGNAKPRLWRIPEEKSLRVYYGLKNDGAEAISARLKGKTFTFPVGVSIAKTNSPATVETEQG